MIKSLLAVEAYNVENLFCNQIENIKVSWSKIGKTMLSLKKSYLSLLHIEFLSIWCPKLYYTCIGKGFYFYLYRIKYISTHNVVSCT